MIGYEKSGKTMDKKGWCGDNFSDAAVPEKLFINFFWPNGFSECKSYVQRSKIILKDAYKRQTLSNNNLNIVYNFLNNMCIVICQ